MKISDIKVGHVYTNGKQGTDSLVTRILWAAGSGGIVSFTYLEMPYEMNIQDFADWAVEDLGEVE
jgi:hypothetical protein